MEGEWGEWKDREKRSGKREGKGKERGRGEVGETGGWKEKWRVE